MKRVVAGCMALWVASLFAVAHAQDSDRCTPDLSDLKDLQPVCRIPLNPRIDPKTGEKFPQTHAQMKEHPRPIPADAQNPAICKIGAANVPVVVILSGSFEFWHKRGVIALQDGHYRWGIGETTKQFYVHERNPQVVCEETNSKKISILIDGACPANPRPPVCPPQKHVAKGGIYAIDLMSSVDGTVEIVLKDQSRNLESPFKDNYANQETDDPLVATVYIAPQKSLFW